MFKSFPSVLITVPILFSLFLFILIISYSSVSTPNQSTLSIIKRNHSNPSSQPNHQSIKPFSPSSLPPSNSEYNIETPNGKPNSFIQNIPHSSSHLLSQTSILERETNISYGVFRLEGGVDTSFKEFFVYLWVGSQKFSFQLDTTTPIFAVEGVDCNNCPYEKKGYNSSLSSTSSILECKAECSFCTEEGCGFYASFDQNSWIEGIVYEEQVQYFDEEEDPNIPQQHSPKMFHSQKKNINPFYKSNQRNQQIIQKIQQQQQTVEGGDIEIMGIRATTIETTPITVSKSEIGIISTESNFQKNVPSINGIFGLGNDILSLSSHPSSLLSNIISQYKWKDLFSICFGRFGGIFVIGSNTFDVIDIQSNNNKKNNNNEEEIKNNVEEKEIIINKNNKNVEREIQSTPIIRQTFYTIETLDIRINDYSLDNFHPQWSRNRRIIEEGEEGEEREREYERERELEEEKKWVKYIEKKIKLKLEENKLENEIKEEQIEIKNIEIQIKKEKEIISLTNNNNKDNKDNNKDNNNKDNNNKENKENEEKVNEEEIINKKRENILIKIEKIKEIKKEIEKIKKEEKEEEKEEEGEEEEATIEYNPTTIDIKEKEILIPPDAFKALQHYFRVTYCTSPSIPSAHSNLDGFCSTQLNFFNSQNSCLELKNDSEFSKYPVLSLHFQNDTILSLKGSDYIERNREGKYCLRIGSNNKNQKTIIGNILFQKYHLVINRESQIMSFSPILNDECSGAKYEITKIDGNNQEGYVDTKLKHPFEFRIISLKDQLPVSGVRVIWRISSGNGSISSSSSISDEYGSVSCYLTLGSISGQNIVIAEVDYTSQSPITFTANATPRIILTLIGGIWLFILLGAVFVVVYMYKQLEQIEHHKAIMRGTVLQERL